MLRYHVKIHADEDGMFVAECPGLPGCVSQGKTKAQARKNIEDAITGYFASLIKHREGIPKTAQGHFISIEEIYEIVTREGRGMPRPYFS